MKEIYKKEIIEITATLLVACKLTKEETISELTKMVSLLQPISDTELIVPSEEEISNLARKENPIGNDDWNYKTGKRVGFVEGYKSAISEIKKLNK